MRSHTIETMPRVRQDEAARADEPHNWRRSFQTFWHRRVITMLFLGFSAGVPLLLIFSSLSLWLREAGVERTAVTFFSWAGLGYSFKFVWAPLVDQLPVPVLTRLFGRRRGWILLAQCFVMAAILAMSLIDPAGGRTSLTLMALAATLLGFSSATQDIVIDAYRIESADTPLQAMMSATYIAGYRVGMLASGAGALVLASAFGSAQGAYRYQAWQWSYGLMAMVMLVGVVTTLMIPEPEPRGTGRAARPIKEYVGVLVMFAASVAGLIMTVYLTADLADAAASMAGSAGIEPLVGLLVEAARLGAGFFVAWLIAMLVIRAGFVSQDMMQDTYIAPVKDFFRRYGIRTTMLLVALVGVYRISDIVLGVIANVFYQDMGFTKPEIAGVVKTFGLFMTIAGGVLGGILSVRYGVMRILFLGAVLSAASNLLFVALASMGHDLDMLYLVISADNLSAGLAGAAFVAFLSSLTNIRFTAMQYAVLSSLMILLPKILGGYSGTIVDGIGYAWFFMMTAILGLPVLVLIWRAGGCVDTGQSATADPARAHHTR